MTVQVNNLNWKIGGEAGYGILSAGEIFAYACAHGGLETFAYLEYPSLIRGGHNTYQVLVREDNVQSHSSQVDLLVALNKETIDRHLTEVVKDGALVYDSNEKDLRDYVCSRADAGCLGVPLEDLTKQAGGEKVMRNMVAVGVSFGLVKYPYDFIVELIDQVFSKKGAKMVQLNQAAAKAGYDYAQTNFAEKFDYQLKVKINKDQRMLINGNEAIALGAIKAGLKFYAAYPMTPATSILQYLVAQERDYKLVVKQTEDEIAAMNMAVGASFAGVRSMVATSGGGFALMSEALGLAGMTECGTVVVIAQRPGPATGLPTWTEQGDLRFALHAGQGDFPRVVLAPGDPEECFYMTFQAHNLADKYQLPVIVLTDKYMAEARQTVPFFNTESLKLDRGELADTSKLSADARFARYAMTPSGVSQRSIPSQPGGMFAANSDEHDDTGMANEEADTRQAQMDKRMKKLQALRSEIQEPVKLYGPKEAEVTLVGWGSTKGPILEAMKKSKNINFLQIRCLEPFPVKEVDTVLRQAKRRVLIENNYSGQL
ncbi:MAG: Pyruvate flavodoxin/ferredoxin oxidoreductase domain protein, partial [Parcubacteria group bacterium GW2011_GWA1_43_27]